MIHDLLAELALGRISETEAEKIYDDLMDSGTVNIPELLGLSKEEWTAFAHGVDFRQLSRWRIHGWPTRCLRCGRSIVVSQFGWLATEAAPHEYGLKHVTCPP